MGSKKLLITGAVIAVVASAAIIVPAVASGVPLARVLPATSVVAPDGAPGDNGNAWGHRKDDPALPGNNGNAWGHRKDSPEFPGDSGRGDADDDGPGKGKAWGHHKDDPEFPGNSGDDE